MRCPISIIIIIILLLSCNQENRDSLIESTEDLSNLIYYQRQLKNELIKKWPVKDIIYDSLPGISLSRAYQELLIEKEGEETIIALIDMPLKISHPELKNNLWTNSNEIPNNGIDDDDNGYVDDINGWNFLGNSEGQNITFMNYEYTRIKKEFDEKIKFNTLKEVSEKDTLWFYHYKRAEKEYNERMQFALQKIKEIDSIENDYNDLTSKLSKLFPLEGLTVKLLDSLALYHLKDSVRVKKYRKYLQQNIDSISISLDKLRAYNRKEVLLNTNFNDRSVQGDNVNDIDDIDYGNNILNHNLHLFNHGTLMAGVLVSNFGDKNLNNILKNIKVMPLCVSGLGDENDKDISLAIRYAVDNGAKVINISSGKYYSIKESWVHNAIKYAEKNNVLIVASSGNNGLDMDKNDVFKYPNDVDKMRSEISNNFIRVGASNYILDSTIVHPATNYGKKQVDIFAPGESIFTTSAQKEDYTYTYGTSAAAAMVSKVAAIILSYHPKLKVSELKELLLQSGVKYDKVLVPKKDFNDSIFYTSFTNLSKSGRVLNAYNSLLMAEKIEN